MEPHLDVAQGRYRNAEFAADLSQVANGKATAEHQDPVEFFSRTYLTEPKGGMGGGGGGSGFTVSQSCPHSSAR